VAETGSWASVTLRKQALYSTPVHRDSSWWPSSSENICTWKSTVLSSHTYCYSL